MIRTGQHESTSLVWRHNCEHGVGGSQLRDVVCSWNRSRAETGNERQMVRTIAILLIGLFLLLELNCFTYVLAY
jgi:hypothetical protein